MERVQRPKIDKNKSIGRKIGYVAALMQVVSVVFAMTVCVFMFKSLITKMCMFPDMPARKRSS